MFPNRLPKALVSRSASTVFGLATPHLQNERPAVGHRRKVEVWGAAIKLGFIEDLASRRSDLFSNRQLTHRRLKRGAPKLDAQRAREVRTHPGEGSINPGPKLRIVFIEHMAVQIALARTGPRAFAFREFRDELVVIQRRAGPRISSHPENSRTTISMRAAFTNAMRHSTPEAGPGGRVRLSVAKVVKIRNSHNASWLVSAQRQH